MALREDGFEGFVSSARERYGSHRIGVFLGTSTSGIQQTELAFSQRDTVDGTLPADFDFRRTHSYFSLADYVLEALSLSGPAAVIRHLG